MCMMVYVASDHPLPTSAWDEARPGFHVEELSKRDEAVRKQFSKPCIYYVGSHEGCGCGFQYGQYEELEQDREESAAVEESRRHLSEFLASAAVEESRRHLSEFLATALQGQAEVELFACWDGDQAATPEHRGRMSPSDLLRDHAHFREKELLVVSEAAR
ncbi:MAG: hypothetical protein BGO49_15335 [Planctomycetales bacterium 71-10]|nr:MAG: hypothetical protein BGO49_15335 [Planctomycetales bacterium 71-10]